jgi:hypothetical protein
MKHGGAKVHGSLIPTAQPIQRVNTRRKPKTTQKRRVKYTLKKPLKTIKKQLVKMEANTSEIGVIKSFIQCKHFIKVFLRKYDTVMNSINQEKRSNYSLFATILATNISSIVKNYDSIMNNSLQNNNDLYMEPEKYLEDFLKVIKEEDVLEKFANIALEHYNSYNNGRMNINNNNNNNDSEYLEYYGFLNDTSKAVIDTIKEYSLDLKAKRKINENTNIDALIMGLTSVKIEGKNNITNIKKSIENNSLNRNLINEDFFSKFAKLGL